MATLDIGKSAKACKKKKKKNEFPTDIAGMPNEVLSETILIP